MDNPLNHGLYAQLLLERELHQVLCRYARACDTRDWAAMDEVFTADAHAHYGSWHCPDRAALVGMVRQHLSGCGPTQHLLGNLEVDASDPQRPLSRIQVRAAHQGLGQRGHLRYDAIGFYEDEWVRLPEGWRIQKRSMTMLLEIGERSVLQPGT